jgi:hypothetical protein
MPFKIKALRAEPTALNKYDYLYVLQGNYSYGWEDLTAAEQTLDGRKQIKNDLKAYRENEGGNYRIIKRRELNPLYKK